MQGTGFSYPSFLSIFFGTNVLRLMLFAHTKDAEKKYKTQKKEGSLRGISPEYVF